MKSLLLLVLHFGVVLAALKVEVQNFYVAEEGSDIYLPCSFTSDEGGTFYEVKWKELRGRRSFTIYHYIRNVVDAIIMPPWRIAEDMKRFQGWGLWLYIHNVEQMDQLTKCCEITVHNPIQTAEACTDIYYDDLTRRGRVAGLYSDEGTDDTEAAAADKQYDCKCLQKVVALGVVAAISFFIMVGLIIYVVKYLKK